MDNTLSKALYLEMNPGDTRRILHEFDAEGNECSKGKDPCMTIGRTTSGLKYFCHRCEEGGFIRMNALSPSETVELHNRMTKQKKEEIILVKEVDDLKIPTDGIRVTTVDNKWNTNQVPWVAIHWLWASGFMLPSDIDFELYWSADYNRLIFPIRERVKVTKHDVTYYEPGSLLGWVGRNVDNSGPKYMTRKQKSKTDRLLYVCPGSDEVVFTEDILSAIKVHKATGYTTVALLTTALSFTLAKTFKGRNMYLWLDGDMYTKSIKKVKRLVSFGVKIHSIRTELDPKEYGQDEIRKHLIVKGE